jgi:two-component system, chemotaxis family, protein-glutamate methylesterase/glutaminase
MNRIRIVLIQNSPASVAFVTDAVGESRDIEIVGTASDFHSGLCMVRSRTPDIVLAQDAPGIVECTDTVVREGFEAGIIIMTSGNDPASAKRVVAALAGGAFDFVAAIDKSESMRSLLLSKIRCCSIKQYSSRARRSDAGNGSLHTPKSIGACPAPASTSFRKERHVPAGLRFHAVLIGVSTGGPVALMELLPGFPASFPVPVIIVLHMPKEFTGPMAAALDRKTNIRVKEATDGEEPVRGKAYLAPGGIHCMLHREVPGKVRLQIIDGPAENGCKPSVDVLFRSAAPLLGDRTMAVVLTGMGIDGTKGSEAIKQRGGFLLAQDEQTSIVWGMPGSIVRAGLANEILPLNRIAARLCELIGA